MNTQILLITPPFTQLNTPYPATPCLKGFLNQQNIESYQCDLGIEVILTLFTKDYLTQLFDQVAAKSILLSDNAQQIMRFRSKYVATIDTIIDFLHSTRLTTAHLICSDYYLPQSSRFQGVNEIDWAFGNMGIIDKARHLATLYLEDISDFIIETIDPHFGFSRYAEKISKSALTFDFLYEELNQPNGLIDKLLVQKLSEKFVEFKPTLVAITIPFPGNLYSALKCGQWIKNNHPNIKIVFGGGYVNTELRQLSDVRVFEFTDFITLDDGETPFLNIIEYLNHKRELANLKRCFVSIEQQVRYINQSLDCDLHPSSIGTPDYSDLPLSQYLSVIEMLNPMHRLWSDGRWNKLMLAHGCYWRKCSFCDTSLDYIQRYEPGDVAVICDNIEKIILQTGERGFHFTDEAAPPVLMRELAIEIIRRKIDIVWWTNIRFESKFTADLCLLLKSSGCIAVSGGIEVASDRLLKMMNKGVSLEQIAHATNHFTQAGIMVHGYLMYGFPTQTLQETIDALEVVRQLFMHGVLHSAYWHRFTMTVHSPVGMNPEKYGVQYLNKTTGAFANNDLEHIDPNGARHDMFGEGLRKALYNYMHGLCFDYQPHEWFEFKTPKTTVSPNFIKFFLDKKELSSPNEQQKIVWIGGEYWSVQSCKKPNKVEVIIHGVQHETSVFFSKNQADWLVEQLRLIVSSGNCMAVKEFKYSYSTHIGDDFDLFWNSKGMSLFRENGLLVV